MQERVALAPQTSFGIGGTARFFDAPADAAAVVAALEWCHREQLPWFVIGGGTNALLADEEFPGLVLATDALRGIEVIDAAAGAPGGLRVAAGTPLNKLVRTAVDLGWGGLERFVGIPGSVGGAVFGNAGSGAHAVGDVVGVVRGFDGRGRAVEIRGDDIDWQYRDSGLPAIFITEVEFWLQEVPRAALREVSRELFLRKSRSQPLAAASAGCVFRNPPGAHAGALIDAAGYKGVSEGGAEVSERHANFIVNRGGATCGDVERLIARVEEAIQAQFGVRLEREIWTPTATAEGPWREGVLS